MQNGGDVAMDMDRAWQAAELRWRCSTLAGFVAAFTDVEGRAREAAELAREAFATDPADLEDLQDIHELLTWWAEELEDHPHRPVDPAPHETDRSIRDHLKDVLRPHLPAATRDRLAGILLSLDVDFHALRWSPTLPCATRNDASYLYGRATMAFDLGHVEEAERLQQRLRELRKKHAEGTP